MLFEKLLFFCFVRLLSLVSYSFTLFFFSLLYSMFPFSVSYQLCMRNVCQQALPHDSVLFRTYLSSHRYLTFDIESPLHNRFSVYPTWIDLSRVKFYRNIYFCCHFHVSHRLRRHDGYQQTDRSALRVTDFYGFQFHSGNSHMEAFFYVARLFPFTPAVRYLGFVHVKLHVLIEWEKTKFNMKFNELNLRETRQLKWFSFTKFTKLDINGASSPGK